MDPMEDVQMNPQANQYQCRQQASLPPTAPAFTMPSRNEQQRYDPVHEANQYYQRNNYQASSSRSAYQTPQQHWQPPNSYSPTPHWNNSTNSQHLNLPGPDTPQYTPHSRFGEPSVWNRDSALEFSRDYYSGPLSTLTSGPSTTGPLTAQARGFANSQEPWQRQYPGGSPITPYTPRRTYGNESNDERPAHHFPTSTTTLSEITRAASSARRSQQRARGPPTNEHSWNYSRRLPSNDHHMALMRDDHSDEEEDDELFEAADYRRHADLLFGDPGEEEIRAMAAMRGALAMGKKVTTRDFLANLEVVPIEQVPENERNCSICYETIGTENPEGLTEKAVRMPKCKHLFGDICIKKWCQDSDTCPYCRDKLPSELSVKRGLTAELRIAQRERARYIDRQQRRSAGLNWSNNPASHGPENTSFRSRNSLSETVRHREEMIDRIRDEVAAYAPADPWAFSLEPNRLSGNDTSERRRPATRGRFGNNRPNHYSGRPTSVGSASFVPQYHDTRPRLQAEGSNSAHASFVSQISAHGIISPVLSRQNSNSGAAYETPAPDSEEAFPPVAMGSGVPTRQYDVTLPRQLGESAFRRSFDQFTAPQNDDWAVSPTRESPISGPSHLGSPFHAVNSPLRRHPTSSEDTISSSRAEDDGADGPFSRYR